MNRPISVFAATVFFLIFTADLPAQDNQSRREFATPGLVVETGHRTAACDVLTFTPDGKYLLAAGDDKVVRTWQLSGAKLQKIPDSAPNGAPLPTLRWPSFREMRGNIYALALSPDGKQVVVGGLGLRDSQTAVLDRFTGTIAHILPQISTKTNFHLRAVAFSPSGKQVAMGAEDGAVWIWDLNQAEARLLGKHAVPNPPKPGQRVYNLIYGLNYVDADRLVSADEHGLVLQWNPQQRLEHKGTEVVRFPAAPLRVWRYAFSGDRKFMAAALQNGKVQVVGLPTGKVLKTFQLPNGQTPSAIALDKSGQHLAVATAIIDQGADATFQKEIGHPIYTFDLTANNPERQSLAQGTYRIEGLAFHPASKLLAVAGGKNHEITLWDLTGIKKTALSKLESPGECVWQVGMMGGRYLGYKTEPARNPPHPNQRGQGTWHVFDLDKRVFVPEMEAKFQPEPPVETQGGWKVVTRPRGKQGFELRASQWYVEDGAGTLHGLPWDEKRDGLPRCYAFLPGNGGLVRLAVGFFNGVSIYELSKNGIRRTRYLTGHDGEVMSLALSKDGKHLVTGSRDQTIAGWSLEDWTSHPQLGTQFFTKESKLWVGKVDTGSPVWEAGLSNGDEILLLVVDRKVIYNRSGKYGQASGTAEDALAALTRPEAGKELYFGWKRPGDGTLVEQLTTLRDRPVWRFFPTRDREWALWRWQDFFYDTSTKGDSYIGWHVNFWDADKGYDVRKTPRFFPAEQFRQLYHDPAKVSAALKTWGKNPLTRISFGLIEPPQLEAVVDPASVQAGNTVKDADARMHLRAVPNSGRENQKLTKVVLWINDFQFRRWEGAELTQKLKADKDAAGLARGIFDLDQFTIPRAMLRSGPNLVMLQAFNKADSRGESKPILLNHAVPRPAATLHGFFIGVGDYTKSKPRQPDLGAHEDAKTLAAFWEEYRSGLYGKVNFKVLTNEEVVRPAVVNHLAALAKQVKPDDLLIFHLGGHGLTPEALVHDLPKTERDKYFSDFAKQGIGKKTFLFVTSKFNVERMGDTTISLDDFYERLVKLPCHKFIMLDACHSGAATPDDRASNDLVRIFTKEKIGPIIVSACRPDQVAYEVAGLFKGDIAHGLFAQSILQTLAKDFDAADTNKNGFLEPEELFKRINYQIPVWIDFVGNVNAKADPKAPRENRRQNPVIFLPELERTLAIVGRPK